MAKAKRAKKSKMPKKLLIVPALVIGVGAATFGVNSNIGNSTTNIIGSNVESYEANDFVKEIFTKDNAKYVPIIFNNHEETLTKGDLINEFKSRGLTIKAISPDADRIVNGTKVTTSDNNTYTIIIYGDVDGNGTVNVRDVQKIIQHLLYGNGYTLTGVSALAANLENVKAGEINVRDAQKIISFIVSNNKIVDDVPASDIANDNEKPVIHITGDNTVTINVFAGYDLNTGVTVTDNLQYLDPNIKSRLEINKGNFDPNKPGTYTITYNVSDLKGNKAVPVTRTIKVVDYVKELEIEKASSFKTEYTDGEKISLDGLKVYEVLAYAGKQAVAIDNNKIAVTPDKADINNQKFTISYGGMSKVIEISVTKNVPIITLNAYENEDTNGTALIKCGTPYVEPGFKAVDKYDGTYIYPDTNPGNKFVVTRTITDSEGNVLTEIDGNTVGEYTVTYTVTNSQGNPSVKRRKVKIVDYITSARIDVAGVTKTDYVDGDTLSFEGIKVYVTKASDPTNEVETEVTLASNIEDNIVLYNRVLNDNKDRNVRISCNVFDGVSENIPCEAIIKINVTKKFETVKNTINVPNNVEIYKETPIARLEAGPDEAPIDTSKLNVTIENPDTNELGDNTYVKLVPVDEKYVNVMLVAVAARPSTDKYRVTITPPAGSDKKITINVSTIENNDLNYIEIGDLKTETGNPFKRFKVGDKGVADLSFAHNYEYVNEAGVERIISVPLENVTASELKRVEVKDKPIDADTTPTNVTGISAHFISKEGDVVSAESNPSAVVAKVKLETTSSVPTTKAGLPIQLEVTIEGPNDSGEYTYINKLVDGKPLTIYAASPETMELGNSSSSITLSLAELSSLTAEGYEVRPIDDNYYTILPVSLYDELYREDGPKDVFANNFSISITGGVSTSYVDYIGIAKDGRTVVDKTDTDTPLSAIGIAISDTVDKAEDELEGKDISISYLALSNVKEMTINVIRQAISSLDYTLIDNEGECYQDVELAKISSGPRQQAISNNDTIGFDVTRKATQVDDAKTWENVQATNLNSSSGEKDGNKNNEVGIITKVEGKYATVKFWAKQAGKYEVTPYVMVGTKKVPLQKALSVDVSENTDVTDIELVYGGNPIIEKDDDGKIILGTVDINSKQNYDIVFKHTYYRKGSDGQPKEIETREVKNVNYSRVSASVTANSTDYSSNTTVNRAYIKKNAITDKIEEVMIIPNSTSGGATTIDPTTTVNALQVFATKLDAGVTKTKTVEFTIGITNSKSSNLTRIVKATIGREVQPDKITVGESSNSTVIEDVSLYIDSTKIPASVKNIKHHNGKIYTLVPIKATKGSGVSEQEIAVSADQVVDDITIRDKTGKIAVFDNVNEGTIEDENGNSSGACIYVQTFYVTDTKEFTDSKVKPVSGSSEANYIGIAINPSKIVYVGSKPDYWDDEYAEEYGQWLALSSINVYNYWSGSGARPIRTFRVNIPEMDYYAIIPDTRN